MSMPISTLHEALSCLERGWDAPSSVSITGELARLKIEVDGERYHSSVPGELARGIWDLQEALYKAAAFALTGSEDIRRLTANQRQQLELVFSVSEGSTDLVASLEGFFTAIGEGIKNMDDVTKARTIVAIAAICAGTFLGSSLLDGYFSQQGKLIEVQSQQAQEQAESARLETVRKMIHESATLARFESAMESGSRAIVRGAADASEIQIGAQHIDGAQIQFINQRAARVPSTSATVTESFAVFQADTHSQESTRYMLGHPNGTEFAVTVIHDAFSADDLEKLWAAARQRKRIELEVTITTNKDGVVRNAQIISVL